MHNLIEQHIFYRPFDIGLTVVFALLL